MLDHLVSEGDSVPLVPVAKADFAAWLSSQNDQTRQWLTRTGFMAEPGTFALLPNPDGALERVVIGRGTNPDLWESANLPSALPAGTYTLDASLPAAEATAFATGWALGCYTFTRYKKSSKTFARLVWPESCDRAAVERTVSATGLVRDLVNTPANDLGPAELADAAKALAQEFGAKFNVIVGDDLLTTNYPAVHAVGRAATPERAPRLIDLRWGPKDGVKVTLVGKGVCFDTGGLDIKPSSAMLTMKKDMGGAAHALGVARMVMAAKLPVNLRVLVPAVENAVGSDAFRPMDVLKTRKGLTVEVGNTDAEGRLILADALTEACTEKPALLIDFATLTGAARVALGPELPALFCNDETLAADLAAAAQNSNDPLWRLPLWQPYRKGLDSKTADLNNIASHSYSGAIIAALFLEAFIDPGTPWAHLDLMAWNTSTRPGRPEGGEAMGLRAVYELVRKRSTAA